MGGAGNWVCPLPLHYVAGVMTVARAATAGHPAHPGSVRPVRVAALPGRNYVSVVVAQLHRGARVGERSAGAAGFDAVLVGGSAIPAGLLAARPGRRDNLIATYGMAETCGGCVYDGVPLDGVRVELGDRAAISLITADCVSRGLPADPDATAASLDGRTVRTHDRGRWTAGRLQVLGRVDDVVITGGVNVDLGLRPAGLSDTEFGPDGWRCSPCRTTGAACASSH